MSAMAPTAWAEHTDRPANWSAVLALTLCVSTLIGSEFMPVSLLSPIARDLHLSEGTAGQAIAISGLFAVLTSLFIARISAGIDRRHLLMGLTALMGLSGAVVAVIQLAITLGAALGGILFDRLCYHANFIAAAILLLASGLLGPACIPRARVD